MAGPNYWTWNKRGHYTSQVLRTLLFFQINLSPNTKFVDTTMSQKYDIPLRPSHKPCLRNRKICFFCWLEQWLSLLHNYIQHSLDVDFAQVQILLTVCQGFVMMKTSDSGPDWALDGTPFVGQQFRKNSTSSMHHFILISWK